MADGISEWGASPGPTAYDFQGREWWGGGCAGVVRSCVRAFVRRRFRGSWVVGRGSWVVGRGSWVMGRGSWVVGRGAR